MPDLTMCKNDECRSRLSCFRFLAQPSRNQQFDFFRLDDDGYCEHYVQVDLANLPLKWIFQLVKNGHYKKRLPDSVYSKVRSIYKRDLMLRANASLIREACSENDEPLEDV